MGERRRLVYNRRRVGCPHHEIYRFNENYVFLRFNFIYFFSWTLVFLVQGPVGYQYIRPRSDRYDRISTNN